MEPKSSLDGLIDEPAPSPGPVVYAAGVALVIASMCSGTGGLQLLLFVRFWDWMFIVPYVFLLLGLLAFPVAGMLTRGEVWAAVVGTVLAEVMLLLHFMWQVYAVTHGLFTPLGCGTVFTTGLAGILVPLSIPFAVQYAQALRRLLEGPDDGDRS